MLDLDALADAIEANGRVVRIVIADLKGSAPREVGASMLVAEDFEAGTIGGGNLEFQAMARAREMLAGSGDPDRVVTRQALGPALNQCCGGAVTLVSELFDAARYRDMTDGFTFQGIHARPVEPGAGPLPETATRMLKRMENAERPVRTQLTGGWLIEAVWRTRWPVYIYGAGHVGRALARVLAPLPQFDVALVDVRPEQFRDLPDTVGQSWDMAPSEVMASAPAGAIHLIMTPEHDVDLDLCHRLLGQPFGWAGLIGSATKWARFRKRLAALGHGEGQIARITCPIGDPGLGKHPHSIAVGVAAELIRWTSAGTGTSQEQSA